MSVQAECRAAFVIASWPIRKNAVSTPSGQSGHDLFARYAYRYGCLTPNAQPLCFRVRRIIRVPPARWDEALAHELQSGRRDRIDVTGRLFEQRGDLFGIECLQLAAQRAESATQRYERFRRAVRAAP